jgi:hypothetical protein
MREEDAMDALTMFLIVVFVGMLVFMLLMVSRAVAIQWAKQKKPQSAAARALNDLLDHEAIRERMGRLWDDAANLEVFISLVNKERGKGIYRPPDVANPQGIRRDE